MKISSLVIILTSFFILNLGYAFNKGDGSEFIMHTEGQKVALSIYIADKKQDKMDVEFHFGAGGFFATNMWQQFRMNISKSQGVQIQRGYIKTGENKQPEIMLREHFHANEGVQVQDFLFSDKKDIQKDFVGEELVELPAGTIKAAHYRKNHDGQTVDFWISEQVKPIGLVKLVSKSKRVKMNNYTIELSSLLKNIKAAINPNEAVQMSKKTKEMLSAAKQK